MGEISLEKEPLSTGNGEGQENKKKFDDQIKSLLDLGFERIGEHDIFAKGDFTISVDKAGRINLFVDYDNTIDRGQIVGIGKGIRFTDSFCLLYTGHDGGLSCTERKIKGGGGNVPTNQEREIVASLEDKNIDQQLTDIGFKEDKNGADKEDQAQIRTFRSSLRSNDKEYKIIAIVSGGKLLNLVKPINDRFENFISPETKVIGYFTKPKEYGRGLDSYIKLADDRIEFTLGSGYGGELEEGSQKVLRELSEKEIGLKMMETTTETNGFKIAGKNKTELIKNLKSINGQLISSLEERMKPGKDSVAGFLGKDESLVNVLAEDNDLILSLGLTHQDLARPLLYARKFAVTGFGKSFQYRGVSYQMEIIDFRGPKRGSQDSPFADGTKASSDLIITNLDNGEQISLSFLVPDMIERYGFYEGRQTKYRVDPRQILKVFPYLSGRPEKP